jgi:hypothetical protein
MRRVPRIQTKSVSCDVAHPACAFHGPAQEEYRETVQRRYFTVTGTKLEGEELEAMIDSGESESIFRSALMDAGRAHVLDTLADIQERHDAFKELERKLLELHQVCITGSMTAFCTSSHSHCCAPQGRAESLMV